MVRLVALVYQSPNLCLCVLVYTGRMNMKAVEVTIQHLIGSGMDPKTENNPYLGFVYTSFQERATKVSPPTHTLAHTRSP